VPRCFCVCGAESIQQRRLLADRAAENAANVEKAYGANSGELTYGEHMFTISHAGSDDDQDSDEWQGFEGALEGKELEEEYEDGEHLATVTIVEDFDPHTIIHGPPRIPEESSALTLPTAAVRPSPQPKLRDRRHTGGLKGNAKVRYETKSARKAEKNRQKARRAEKAERAGGKGARSKTFGRRR
jgi:ribosomal RNA-processing protein 17